VTDSPPDNVTALPLSSAQRQRARRAQRRAGVPRGAHGTLSGLAGSGRSWLIVAGIVVAAVWLFETWSRKER
jgi:hypothetical protein